MKNTEFEREEYGLLLSDLEHGLFDCIKSLRDENEKTCPEANHERHVACYFMKQLQTCRAMLNGSYGFSLEDSKSAELIKNIRKFIHGEKKYEFDFGLGTPVGVEKPKQ